MKKIIVIALSLVAFAAVASAQPRALGIRATYGAELSYQHTLGGSNFAEFDLGWAGNSGFNLAGIYDFIIGGSDNFNFYAGPGADLSVYKYTDGDKDKTGLGLGIAGQLGMEYNFNIPLTLSLDWRPVFNFIGNTGFGWQSIALGIRYRF